MNARAEIVSVFHSGRDMSAIVSLQAENIALRNLVLGAVVRFELLETVEGVRYAKKLRDALEGM